MAVVVVNKRKEEKKEVFCPNCESTLLYEKSDVKIGCLGCEVVYCPECGYDVMISAQRIMPPTFPQTFYRFGKYEAAKKVSDEETQRMINEVLKEINTLEVGGFFRVATGNTSVIALKYQDEIDIIVAKDYWEDTLINEN